MTLRAVLIGLLGAALISALDYLSRFAWPLMLSFDTHMPASVFGAVVVVALGVNPLLFRLRRPLRLQAGELATILVLSLVGCGLANWTHTLTRGVAMPIQFYQTNAGWRKVKLLTYVPPAMLPGQGRFDPKIMDGFLSGLGREDHPIDLSQIPWGGWTEPLLVWIPIVVLIGMAAIGLSLVVHRQWSTHERLRYPIAEFGTSLMAQEGGQPVSSLYRDKFFWIGLVTLLAIGMINYANAWWPEHTFAIPTSLDLSALLQRFPKIRNASWRNFILYPDVIPIAVSFAFFMASDVSFSLATCYIAFELTTIMLVPLGLEPGSKSYVLGSWDTFMRFGSFLGVAVILLYTGRRYYGAVLRRAALLKTADPVESYAVWGMRLAVVAAGAAAAILMGLGLEWLIAVLTVGLLLLIFVVVSRMSAESGLFAIRAAWLPVGVITGLLGPATMGPQMFMTLAVFSILMAVDTQSTLMPYVVNGLRMWDDSGAKVGRAGPSILAALVLGAAVAVPVGMWVNYNYGVKARQGWAISHVPQLPFITGEQVITGLKLLGQLGDYAHYGPLERLLHAQPNPRFVGFATLGLGLVLAFSLMRLRYHWWPLHPIFLLAWGSWTSGRFYFSFLLGWLIKQAVMWVGGGRTYRRAKPLMIGVIAGDLLAGLVQMVIATIYYLVTGFPAKR